MNLFLGLGVLWAVIQLNSAILTIPSDKSVVSRKEKRGTFGFGIHGHHHSHHNEHFDDWHPLPSHGVHPPPQTPPAHPGPPVPLGAHFHTTVTRKFGVPIPYPVPIKIHVPVFKPYPVHVPIDRPVPQFVPIPHPVLNGPAPHPHPHTWPAPHHHNHK